MQTIARANRVTDHLISDKPKKNGLIVDYYNVFRNLKKAFASYGGGTIAEGDKKDDDAPVQEKDQLYVLLQDAIDQCESYCRSIGVELTRIVQSDQVFGKLSLFDEYADILVSADDRKRQFIVFDNTIDALYEACRPDILSRKKDFPLVAIIHYLREVVDGRADRGTFDNAKRRISQLLNESIVAQSEDGDAVNQSAEMTLAAEKKYLIKAWKQIDLSKFDIEKLREQYTVAPYKHIEISDLRAFISGKLQQMMERNVTRNSFAQKLQEIIDRYNSGGAATEDYFGDLVNFVESLKEEERRAAREGLTEHELELFDLLKKESLTKDEEQKVKLAAKHLLKRLKEEKPKVLVHDWHKDTQTRNQVKNVIEQILDSYLPDPAYNRTLFASKSNQIFEHFFLQAMNGEGRVMA